MRCGRRICSWWVSSSGFTTKLRLPCVYTRTVEFEHQPQLILDFAQKDVEYKTHEVSEKSADCMGWSSASGSKRQRHNCNQQHMPAQAAQKRESEEGEKRKERERCRNRGDREPANEEEGKKE